AGVSAGAPLLRARRGRSARDRLRTLALERVQPAALLGSRAAGALRCGGSARASLGHARIGPDLLRPRALRRAHRRARRAGIRGDLPAPRRRRAAPLHRGLRRARAAGLRREERAMTPRTSDLWWKKAVIYCLDVET